MIVSLLRQDELRRRLHNKIELTILPNLAKIGEIMFHFPKRTIGLSFNKVFGHHFVRNLQTFKLNVIKNSDKAGRL